MPMRLDPIRMAALMRGIVSPTIIELGAHIGTDTAWLSAFADRYYAFEPDPRNVARFEKRDLNVKLIKAAVGAVTGRQELHMATNRASSSLLMPGLHKQLHPHVLFPETIKVDVWSLDDFCETEGIETVALIWADVQGAVRELISGARRTLEKTQFFYTEALDRPEYIGEPTVGEIDELLGLAWDLRERYPYDALFANREKTYKLP